MKILVSAYACNPYGGSEPGVGWAAVCRIARSHDVFVLADIHNKPGWDAAAKEGIIPANVRVRFVREKASSIPYPLIAHIDSWLSYARFNRMVLDAALTWHRETGFDLCHQVTIAGWRMPSPLWRLPIPFVWGPIGGAGHIPPAFRPILSPAARIFECARDVQSWMACRSGAFLDCIRESAVVIAANEETRKFLESFREGKPLVKLPIASVSPEKARRFRRPPDVARRPGPIRLFAGGYMEGRKGVSLALRALALVKRQGLGFHYTVAGIGPEIASLRRLASSLDISEHVDFHTGFRGDEFLAKLHDTDVYLLPSFRESTPVTLLEACLAACHPVVADTSAQGEIVRLCGGTAVAADNIDQMVAGLADAVVRCSTDMEQLPVRTAAISDAVAKEFSSDRYDEILAEAYAACLQQP